MFRHMWTQKFKANPLATVFGTLLSGGLFLGLIFFSVVFAVGLLLIGVVALVYVKLFGSSQTVKTDYVIRKDFSRPSPRGRSDRPDIIEGDFDVLESPQDSSSTNKKTD